MIKPYHTSEFGVLYHGDCLEIMPLLADKSVDRVLTDPPYGINGGSGGQQKDYSKCNYISDFEDTPDYYRDVTVKVIELCIIIAKTVVLTPGLANFSLLPQPNDVGCFYQPAAARHSKFGFSNFTPIFYYGQYPYAGKHNTNNSKQLTERAEKNGHPCPKPIVAWNWLLNRISLENDTILDPFAGSGTTAVACINTKRRYILIEMEEKYCEIAAKRIETTLDQTDLFRGEL